MESTMGGDRQAEPRIIWAWTIPILLLLYCQYATAYETTTHRDLARRASLLSGVSTTLQSELSISTGLQSIILGAPLVEWTVRGADKEDSFLRYLNHFHDPLRGWNQSGLGYSFRYSPAVRYAFEDSDWSWGKARQSFLVALTDPDRQTRDRSLAQSFEALGHVLHLIQDMASPAHVRNDPHPFGITYEKGLGELQESRDPANVSFFQELISDRILPDIRWQTMDQNRLAPNPIARLFDTDKYVGINPGTTGAAFIGLAEYTNANFLSEDRTLSEDTTIAFRYPYPARSSTSQADYLIKHPSGEWVTRPYYVKVRDGDSGYRLATVGYLQDYSLRYGLDMSNYEQKLTLDGFVYRDYAAKLLPRAVGYSVAALDYFFRGKLDVRRDTQSGGQARLLVVNRSPEALGAGGEFQLYQDTQYGFRTPVTGASSRLPEAVPKDNDASPIVIPIPAGLPTDGLTLVYSGPLGLEQNAVIGKRILGVSVEQVYRDWSRDAWVLRSSRGVYALPLREAAGLASHPASVTWGGRDNQLVAVTDPTGPDGYRAILFEIQRGLGSAEVPTEGDAPGSFLPSVAVRPVSSTDLYERLSALSVGTTATVTTTAELVEYLAEYAVRVRCALRDGTYSLYDCTTATSGDRVVPGAGDSRTLQEAFDLILDRQHHATGASSPRPYAWWLRDLGTDTAGRLIGLVSFGATVPTNAEECRLTTHAMNTAYEVVPDGASLGCGNDFTWPIQGTVIVDLSVPSLLAKTVDDAVTLSHRSRTVRFLGARTASCFAEFTGGGWRDGETTDDCRIVAALAGSPSPTDGTRIAVELSEWEGPRYEAIGGVFHPALTGVGLESRIPPLDSASAIARDVVYRVDERGDPVAVRFALRNPGAPRLPEMRWCRRGSPSPSETRFVFTRQAESDQSGMQTDTYVAWPDGSPVASIAHEESGLVSGDWLGNAAGVLKWAPFEDTWHWLPWSGTASRLAAPEWSLRWGFVALEPDYLYHAGTGRFHTLQEGFPAEERPEALVADPFAPSTGYHVVGR